MQFKALTKAPHEGVAKEQSSLNQLHRHYKKRNYLCYPYFNSKKARYKVHEVTKTGQEKLKNEPKDTSDEPWHAKHQP